MPNILRQFYKPAIAPPDPPEQERVIHSEVSHSFPPEECIITLGIPEPANPLPDPITVSLSHAF